MRIATKLQLQLGEIDIANIRLDPRSRDDIPQLLRGLQYLYTDKKLRAEIFEILAKLTPKTVTPELGRPGMALWKIFVMGSLRLNLNCDYDRLQELVNNHKTIRQMLGHAQKLLLTIWLKSTGWEQKQALEIFLRLHCPLLRTVKI